MKLTECQAKSPEKQGNSFLRDKHLGDKKGHLGQVLECQLTTTTTG
jgi:hypothetical protein